MTIITMWFGLMALGLFVGAIFYIAKGRLGLAAVLAVLAFVVAGGTGVLTDW